MITDLEKLHQRALAYTLTANLPPCHPNFDFRCDTREGYVHWLTELIPYYPYLY